MSICHFLGHHGSAPRPAPLRCSEFAPHTRSSGFGIFIHLAPEKFFFRVNPSCGRLSALARCRRGGSPRASPRAASSPRDALATPHPGKKNDRAPPPPASPCLPLPLPLRLRLALQPRTRTRTRSRRSRSLPRSNPPPEFRSGSQKVPTRTANRLDHRRWRFCKGTQGQCLI